MLATRLRRFDRIALGGLLLAALWLGALAEPAGATGQNCGLFDPCPHSHDYCRFVDIFTSICTERGDGGESCSGLGQGTCKNGLACDIQGECRHQPGPLHDSPPSPRSVQMLVKMSTKRQ